MDLPLSSRLRETHDPIGGETFSPRHGTNIVRLPLSLNQKGGSSQRARSGQAAPDPTLAEDYPRSKSVMAQLALSLSAANSLLLGLVNIEPRQLLTSQTRACRVAEPEGPDEPLQQGSSGSSGRCWTGASSDRCSGSMQQKALTDATSQPVSDSATQRLSCDYSPGPTI